MTFRDHEGQGEQQDYRAQSPNGPERPRIPVMVSPRPEGHLKRMLESIPPSAEETDAHRRDRTDEEIAKEADAGIAAAAQASALKASEARRDAILAVALAIKRRGANPLTDWTTKDTDTAYAIADQLMALSA